MKSKSILDAKASKRQARNNRWRLNADLREMLVIILNKDAHSRARNPAIGHLRRYKRSNAARHASTLLAQLLEIGFSEGQLRRVITQFKRLS